MEAAINWSEPENIREVQRCLDLTGYYRKFVQCYEQFASPISDLIGHHNFKWDMEQEDAFQRLKEALFVAPVLAI